jgi:hypothetical protein
MGMTILALAILAPTAQARGKWLAGAKNRVRSKLTRLGHKFQHRRGTVRAVTHAPAPAPVVSLALTRSRAGRLINTNPAIRGAVRRIRQAHGILVEAQLNQIQSNLEAGRARAPLGYFYRQRQVMERGPQISNFKVLQQNGKRIGYSADVTSQVWTPAGLMRSFRTIKIELNGKVVGPASYTTFKGG